jgi:prepilin-type N-terminal cleavage/methylation domain-containing protein
MRTSPWERTHPVLNRTRSHEDQNLLERGFTLVELLIVIVILGILAGIVVFAVGNLTSNAKTNACNTEKQTVSTAVEAYKANTGAYPVDGTAPVVAIDFLTGLHSAPVPAGVGILLKSAPTNYTITSGTGAVTVTAAGTTAGCT